MNRVYPAMFALMAIVALRNGVAAQSDLSASIQQAKSALAQDRLPDLASTQQQVLESLDVAQLRLSQSTSPENFAAWLGFLKLETLREAIQSEASVAVRGRAAVELRRRLVGPEAGLEMSMLLGLREKLDRYVAALQYGSDPEKGIAAVQREFKLLGEIIDPLAESSRSLSELSPESIAQLESLVQSISNADQGASLVTKLRGRFSYPNLRLWVAGDAVTDAITRSIDDCSAVNDCILGTRLRGTSRLVGGVQSQLMPAIGHIGLLIRLDGAFSSSTRGVNGPVELDSVGHGQVYAARQIAITERGVTLGDVVSTAQLNTEIQRIIHPLKLVRRIAAKQAAQQKPMAQAIARSKLENRVVTQFREQTDQVGKQRFDSIDDAMQPWLSRLSIPRPERTLESTSSEIFVTVKLQKKVGFASPTPPPHPAEVLINGGQAITAAIQVHESVVSNSIDAMLSGETFNPQKLRRTLKSFGIDPPEDESDDQAAFEIDFATFRPVFFEARDGELRLGIRGSRFAQGDRELKRTLQVVTTYRPVLYPDGTTQLVRDEKIDLSFPGGRRLTIAQTAIKANIIEGFDKLFPSALLIRPLPIPPSVKLPSLQGKIYRVVSVDAHDGWLSIAVR